jgi:hypothetical protein
MIHIKQDGSFVVDTQFGINTCHVTKDGEWSEKWAELEAQRKTNPRIFMDEPTPLPPQPTDTDLRMERNRLLSESDKYMVPDYPIPDALREKWKVYRQSLRDDFKCRPAQPS